MCGAGQVGLRGLRPKGAATWPPSPKSLAWLGRKGSLSSSNHLLPAALPGTRNWLWLAWQEPVKPLFYWSWRPDSNPRPADYKSAALPTELRQRVVDGPGGPPSGMSAGIGPIGPDGRPILLEVKEGLNRLGRFPAFDLALLDDLGLRASVRRGRGTPQRRPRGNGRGHQGLGLRGRLRRGQATWSATGECVAIGGRRSDGGRAGIRCGARRCVGSCRLASWGWGSGGASSFWAASGSGAEAMGCRRPGRARRGQASPALLAARSRSSML